jgi:hypothetical protein
MGRSGEKIVGSGQTNGDLQRNRGRPDEFSVLGPSNVDGRSPLHHEKHPRTRAICGRGQMLHTRSCVFNQSDALLVGYRDLIDESMRPAEIQPVLPTRIDVKGPAAIVYKFLQILTICVHSPDGPTPRTPSDRNIFKIPSGTAIGCLGHVALGATEPAERGALSAYIRCFLPRPSRDFTGIELSSIRSSRRSIAVQPSNHQSPGR